MFISLPPASSTSSSPAPAWMPSRCSNTQGIRVHFPEEQTCCGQPAYTSGFPDEARKVAAHQLTLFPNDWPVVVPSGSCAGMMKHHYPTLFAADPQRKAKAEALSARIYEFTDFLVNVLGWQPEDKGGDCTVVLHTSVLGPPRNGRPSDRAQAARRPEQGQGRAAGSRIGMLRLRRHLLDQAAGNLRRHGRRQGQVAQGHRRRARGQRRLRLPDEHPRPRRLEGRQEGRTRPTLPGEHIASFLLRRTEERSGQ